jgi:exodeoxyribonuclease-3
MRVVTWNINGLRSVAGKGFKDWFVRHAPDIIALQEIKAQEIDVVKLLDDWKSHYKIFLHPAAKKGYSGTAFLIRNEIVSQIISVNLGIQGLHEENEGRLIWLESEKFYLINGYFPNGKPDHSRVDYKLEFSRAVLEFANQLKKKNKGVVICGDINTAHKEIDLSNPKANVKTTGFLPHEREFIDEVLAHGYVDALRHMHPEDKNIYSWWTYRGDCRERNIGWRLDYFFVSDLLKDKIKAIAHHRDVLGSDHCPVEITFTI